jgi:hypothetical protein
MITKAGPDVGIMATVIRSENAQLNNPEAVVIIDAKALYDTLLSEQTLTEDRRASLETASIRESLREMAAICRWVPHSVNPADALTKHRGAHMEPLMRLLKRGSLRIAPEQEALEKMSEEREKLGYTARPRIAATTRRGSEV